MAGNNGTEGKRRFKRLEKFTRKMHKKLLVLILISVAAFVVLSIRMYLLQRDHGAEYQKQILSQQSYDSITLQARRGDIRDSNGIVLATSEKVYSVIIDAVQMLDKPEYLEPTMAAAPTYHKREKKKRFKKKRKMRYPK